MITVNDKIDVDNTSDRLWLKRFFIIGLVILFLSLGLWHKPVAYANKTIVVSVPILNVRDQAGITYPIITKVYQGDRFSVLKETKYWDEIRLKNDQIGWVANWLVKQQQMNESSNTTAIVKATALNIREEPGVTHKIIGLLNLGDSITIVSQMNGWSEILLNNGNGWVSSKYIAIPKRQQMTIELLFNGSRLRSGPHLDSKILSLGNKGDHFQVIGQIGKWDKIILNNGEYAYVANWIVKQTGAKQMETQSTTIQAHYQSRHFTSQLTDKIIVLDPGHGGTDDGTTSLNGVHEKQLTLETAQHVAKKLKAAGAIVYLTRSTDQYISLQKRVIISENDHADAFISLHYNSSPMPNIKGMTSFYYNDAKDRLLATDIHRKVIAATGLDDRGVRYGDLHVLRENSQPSTLIELGFLSSPQEQTIVEQASYQDKVAQGIYEGLLDYFR